MRAVVIGCLLASTILGSVLSVGADAQETYCAVNQTGVTTCVNAYVAQATNGGNICGALDSYIGCLGTLFSCNAYYAATWNTSLTAYRSVWDSYCSLIPAINGESEPSMVFGDPHYRLTNGSYQTCNALGENTLAVSKYFTVTAVHSAIGTSGSNGTVVTSVTVQIFHAGFPSDKFTWTVTSGPPTTKKNGISVTSGGVDAGVLGLKLKVIQKDDHLVLGFVTKKLTGGILLNGCGNAATLPDVSNITGPCANVPANFRATCQYDADRMTNTWAVSSSVSASNTESETVASAKGQNGAATPFFAVASALVVAVATMAAMVL